MILHGICHIGFSRERERKKERVGFGQFTLFNLSDERFVPIPNLNLSGENLS
jgi:hypothetical protein